MASPMVTLERAYFDTLIRRSQFVQQDVTTTDDPTMVTIQKQEHERLLHDSREYAILLRRLRDGGLSNESLEILLVGNDAECGEVETTVLPSDANTFLSQIPMSVSSSDPYRGRESYMPRPGQRSRSWLPSFTSPSSSENLLKHKFRTPLPVVKRSIQLVDLPKNATLAEVTDIIRGGALVDIRFTSSANSVYVTFVAPEAAARFFQYVRVHGLRLRGSTIGIRWCNRQFVITEHSIQGISRGCTRNFVIRSKDRSLFTEERIRGDLDHVHNLEVIKVWFTGNNAHVSCNSITQAVVGRGCLISRAMYKSTRIDWEADECDAPLPAIPRQRRERAATQSTTPTSNNRFQALQIEASVEESDQETEVLGVSTTAGFGA